MQKRRRMRWVAPVLMMGPLLFGLTQCSESKLLGAGEVCFQAVECAPGLICAKVGDRRVCTNDLTSVESPSGYDASRPDGGLAEGAVTYDTGVQPDTAVADTFVPPPPNDGG